MANEAGANGGSGQSFSLIPCVWFGWFMSTGW